ncbi:MAG TPA: ABC transporter permease [Blastocatellia bacterium]|nr:ABC transporter permease [Blastocatellia bacterium]
MSLLSRCKRLFTRPHLRLLALFGVIVPRRLRANWRQEWEAELRHREELLAEWDRLDWRSKLDLLQRSASAFWDALWLQPKRLEDEMFQDIRFGLRMLLKTPGFTLIAIFTLALGIGASTAIFSAVNPILFESLPYPHADRMVMIWEGRRDGGRIESTFGAYRAFVERSRSFESLAVMKSWQPTIIGSVEPERLEGQCVSASYFRALGVAPAIGRDFLESDDQLNGPNAAIISDGLWRRRFGGDSAIIGRQVRLDDNSFTVIGVMPRAFENALTPSAEIWSPLQYDKSLPPQSREWGHHLRMVGRLRPGAGADQAGREIDQIFGDLKAIYPMVLADYGVPDRFIVNALQDDITSAVKPALLAVLGAVVLLLMIACVNVANLLLARGAQRRGEFTIRAALGAGRTRMIRQLLTESLLLAVLGGALGMVVAEFGVRALAALSPPGLPRVGAIRVDGAVFIFGMGITTLIGLVVGLIPALYASRSDLRAGLQQGSRTAAGASHLTRRALVVVEVALALVLLVGSGLLLRSLQGLFAISPGFDASSMLTMQVQISGRQFNRDTMRRFFEEALEAVRQVPGVTAAAFTSQLPLSGEKDEYGVRFEPGPDGRPERGYSSFRYGVTPGYFEAMGIPLRRGRLLDTRDVAGAPLAVVISESLAKRKFPDQDPIGKRAHVGRQDIPWYTVVGVVGDVKQASLSAPQADAAYITAAQWYFADNPMSLVVRARGDVAALTPAIRKAIWSVDKDQPIVRVATMDELLAATAAERSFALILFEAFGLVALALAAIGIYGVLSGSVNERTREIGVRMALGAERLDVLSLILRQGLKLTLGGVGAGLLAAWAATRLLTKLLYGVSPTDPLTFGGVALLLTGVALLACYLPARRATKVDPLVALRQE